MCENISTIISEKKELPTLSLAFYSSDPKSNYSIS